MKLSNNSSVVILIFDILKFRNIDRYKFRHSKLRPLPGGSVFRESIGQAIRISRFFPTKILT